MHGCMQRGAAAMGGFGIDLGTANTVVCQVRRGIVLDEPSVMVVRSSARGKRLTPLLLGHDARALTEAADEAGIRRVRLLPEPIAGVVGCGVNPLEPRSHMVVDVGGGTAEVTAFCFGGVLAHRSCRVAG